ncbi:MAG: DUF1460 domain-containing protein [Muribaculaceae bacterium]|nr:DUF1460 domain-containing protein [Muribaculaceae bacterium]
MKKTFLIASLFFTAFISHAANLRDDVRFHNEQSDTTRITQILIDAEKISKPGERISAIAHRFIDTPYVAHTLEDSVERLTVNLDELDCTTFVETVMALAYTAGERRTSWHDFIYNLRRLRYRGGVVNGYPSRLHYISDWAVDNSHRGNFTEVTDRIPQSRTVIKSINFMSRHRDLYPLLADSANFAKIKEVEQGYINHQYPIVRTNSLNNKQVWQSLREGDIIALTTSNKNLDVSHLGLITIVDGKPHLLHASSSLKKVTVTTVPLYDFLRRNPSLTGIRVFRLNE